MDSRTAIAHEKYVAFTSFKKDGTPVATPVWIVEFEDGVAFTTGIDSFKVKRIAHTPRVQLQPSDMRGRVTAGTSVVSGTAELLTGERYKQVEPAIRRKYSVGARLLGVWEAVARLIGRSEPGSAAIKVTLEN